MAVFQSTKSVKISTLKIWAIWYFVCMFMCVCVYLQAEDDPMMAQVQLVAQKKLILLREKEKELQQEVR